MNKKPKEQLSKKEKWHLALAIGLVLLLLSVHLMNHFRWELFGVMPGYAPHNFSFNLSFFFPAHLLIFAGSLFVFLRTLIRWKAFPNLWIKVAALALTVPIAGWLMVEIAPFFLL